MHVKLLRRFAPGRVLTVTVLMLTSLPASGSEAAPLWTGPVSFASSREELDEPQVAVNAAGQAAILWGTPTGLRSAIRARPGANWRTVKGTLPVYGGEPEFAMDGRGDLFAAWGVSLGYHQGSGIQVGFKPARGGWQTPVTLTGSGELGEGQGSERPDRLAVDARGDAIVVWPEYAAGAVPTESTVNAAVMSHASGTWSAPFRVAANGVFPQVAIDASGNATIIWRASGIEATPSIESAVVSTSSPGRISSGPTVIGVGRFGEGIQIGVDDRGDAMALWTDFTEAFQEPFHPVLMAAARPYGGAWTSPVQLSSAGAFAHQDQLAIDAEGDVLAAWASETQPAVTLDAASGSAVDGSWRAPQQVATIIRQPPPHCRQDCAPRPSGFPRLAMSPGGSGLLVWDQPEVGEMAALRPAGASSWKAAVNLDAALNFYGPPAWVSDFALDARGGALAVLRSENVLWTDELVSPAPLRELRLTRSRFQVARSSRGGTSIRFRLSHPARLRVALIHLARGAREGLRCNPLPPGYTKKSFRHCVRKEPIGLLSDDPQHGGAGSLRLAAARHGRALKPGHYEAVVTTGEGKRRSIPIALPFTVVPRA